MRGLFGLAFLLTASACTTAPLRGTGAHIDEGLVRSDGLLTQSLIGADKARVLAARTVRIVPTRFSAEVGDVGMGHGQRALVANAVDRVLCAALGERLEVVTDKAADLTLRATVTHAAPTNTAAALLSRAASLAVPPLLPDTPVIVPRLPIGLGSLSVEAEARDRRGRRAAVMIWGRGADAVTSAPRLSTDGDAYDLAGAFAADFGNLLVTGESPLNAPVRLPILREVSHVLGAGTPTTACAAYGPAPGLIGQIGRRMGLPPDWTDRGARPADRMP